MFRKASAEYLRDKARSRDPQLFDRLLSKVKVGAPWECWPIIKPTGPDGYGAIKVNGVNVRAHRLMFSLYFPTLEAPVVRHICHNPACVNPVHLRAGTPKDNAMDRVFANRGADLRGENNGRAKLTAEQVLAIRSSDKSCADLGREFGVSKVMASRIRRGLAWTHI